MNNGMNMSNGMGMGMGMGMNMNQQPTTTGNAPDYMLWLILGIVQICSLCCCNCFTFIAGILTVIFVCGANNMYKIGDMMTYASKMKTAKIINIIGWALIIVSIVINIVTGIFNSIMSYIQ